MTDNHESCNRPSLGEGGLCSFRDQHAYQQGHLVHGGVDLGGQEVFLMVQLCQQRVVREVSRAWALAHQQHRKKVVRLVAGEVRVALLPVPITA